MCVCVFRVLHLCGVWHGFLRECVVKCVLRRVMHRSVAVFVGVRGYVCLHLCSVCVCVCVCVCVDVHAGTRVFPYLSSSDRINFFFCVQIRIFGSDPSCDIRVLTNMVLLHNFNCWVCLCVWRVCVHVWVFVCIVLYVCLCVVYVQRVLAGARALTCVLSGVVCAFVLWCV